MPKRIINCMFRQCKYCQLCRKTGTLFRGREEDCGPLPALHGSHPSGKPPALPPFSAEWRRCKSYSPYFHTRYKVQFLGHRQKEGGSFFWPGAVSAHEQTQRYRRSIRKTLLLARYEQQQRIKKTAHLPPPNSPCALSLRLFARGGGAPPPRNIN